LLFLYDATDGSAALGRLRRGEIFQTLKEWPPSSFAPSTGSWTHVIGGSNGLLLFYQSTTGEGKTGGFKVGEGEFKMLKDYRTKFAGGWTHIVGL
jgi:hypothetical protein